MNKAVQYARTSAVVAALILGCYLLFANTAPFNITKHYPPDSKNISSLGPIDRVQLVNGVNKQFDNLVYFSSKMPFNFDHARLKITYRNPTTDQQVLIGYKDQKIWHYNLQALDAPFLNNLNWQKIGSGPCLYQRKPTYTSVTNFVNKPPKNSQIGVFDYTNPDLLFPNPTLTGYKPSNKDTVINVPLRGKVTFYAYLDGEPFRIKFTKRDLNWYQDPDVTKINIYKGQIKVYTATIDDDGDATDDHVIGQPQDDEIKNPGPGLPEPGVYKIAVDAPADTVITSISTNLHKLVFEGPFNPINNSSVFPGLVDQTQATQLYTNATDLTALTYHNSSLQTIDVNDQKAELSKINQPIAFSADTSAGLAKLNLPRSDVILNGAGYFAFTPEQFFEPSPYKLLQINDSKDIDQVDYIITNYKPPKQLPGGWEVAEKDFDLKDAVIQKGQLSWLIDTPNLKQNGNTIEIKSIEMTLSKKGWL